MEIQSAGGILPITGADMEPMVAVASFCLLGCSVVLVVGRTRRATNPPDKRRR